MKTLLYKVLMSFCHAISSWTKMVTTWRTKSQDEKIFQEGQKAGQDQALNAVQQQEAASQSNAQSLLNQSKSSETEDSFLKDLEDGKA